MSNVIQFGPRKASSATQNLEEFISVCQREVDLLTGDAFESYAWNVSRAYSMPGAKHNLHMHFCSWATARKKTAREPMSEPFGRFAKAYSIYEHSRNNINSFMPRLTMLRALNDVLVRHEATCITELSTVHLDEVCRDLKERLSVDVAYHAGCHLERLNDFVVEHKIAPRSVIWRCWLPPSGRERNKIGKEFDERRQEKIPSPAAFEALGSIFSIATSASDLVVTGVCALLCAAPGRIAEVLRLPVDCEVPQKSPAGLDVLGLRWWPAKGASPMVKPVVSSMRDVVEEALRRLRDVTAHGRTLARWYTENPGKLYLREDVEHLRGRERLTMRDVDSILFGSGPYEPGRPMTWCDRNKIPKVVEGPRNGRIAYVRFADVEKAVLRLVPRGFPIADKETGLQYADSLFVVRRQELTGSKAPYVCMFESVEQSDVGGRLGVRKQLSIFERHGFTENDGSPIWLSTHQFRHYLNTLAQSSNLDQLDIARWSGRRNVSQNTAYDHTSGRDLLEQVRDAITGENLGFGPLARLHKVTLIPRDQFARLHIPTAHTTDFGHCVHDFTMLPCQIHQDCVNCNESVCIKGDEVRERNIRLAREEARLLLDKAEAAQKESEAGADRWLVHQKLTFERLDNLCRIFDDPNVPAGAVIQLSGIVPPSRLAQAAEQRLANAVGADTRKAA